MSFRFSRLLPVLLLATFISLSPAYAQNSYYFPAAQQFDAKVPTPQQFLGYEIGSHYTRHDQLVAYFNELARVSDKVKVEVIGQSYEHRPLLLVTVTSPRNHARGAEIAAQRQAMIDPTQPLPGDDAPAVVWLGYSVHGNETSSAEAAMLTAYYLAANQDAETARWLEHAVVVIDPAQNPDGRDRAANWHNSWGSQPPSADPADKEHVEPFPSGRVNHYFTDLNRDWLALSQTDSWPKVAAFHRWYPNIQIDFHEMGKDSTYYFEPSPKSMESPLLPKSSYEANKWLARFHAQALDALGSLYYTGENFDNFSPIYGSTYPDFHGAVGVTVEQASSRGLVQESVNGPLHFNFTIRNQVATGLASVRGAVEDRDRLFALQKEFFRSALKQAAAYPVHDWVFGDAADATLTNKLLAVLLQHRIEVHALGRDVDVDGKHFPAGSAYVVPARQAQFRLAHSIFEFTPPVKGDVFYSGTSYAVAPAYGLRYAGSRGALPSGARVDAVPAVQGGISGGRAGFAYVADARDFGSYRLLGALLGDDVRVRTAHQPFTAATAAGDVAFGQGAVVIPVAGQRLDGDALQAKVLAAAQAAGITVHALASGRAASGIDLGSDSVRVLRKPSIALVMGEGVSATEIGSTWFALDTALGLPSSKIDPAQLASVDLSRYTSIVLSGGTYATVSDAGVAALKRWIGAGGSLVVYGSGARWAIDKGLAEAKLREGDKKDDAERLDFGTVRDVFALGRVSGNILSADIDPTHPLGFGVQQRRIWVNKEGGLVFEPAKNAFLNVVNIDRAPVVNGYLSDANRARVAGSSYLQVVPTGSGNVVLFADDPAHRKYWHGTERLLLNALLQANHLNTPKQRGE